MTDLVDTRVIYPYLERINTGPSAPTDIACHGRYGSVFICAAIRGSAPNPVRAL